MFCAVSGVDRFWEMIGVLTLELWMPIRENAPMTVIDMDSCFIEENCVGVGWYL
jgi:hypothetical protein